MAVIRPLTSSSAGGGQYTHRLSALRHMQHDDTGHDCSPPMPKRSLAPSDWMRWSRRRSGWEPTCTTWGRCGCHTRFSISRGRLHPMSSASCRTIRSTVWNCWLQSSSPGTSAPSSAPITSARMAGLSRRAARGGNPAQRAGHRDRGRVGRPDNGPQLPEGDDPRCGAGADGTVPKLVEGVSVQRVHDCRRHTYRSYSVSSGSTTTAVP